MDGGAPGMEAKLPGAADDGDGQVLRGAVYESPRPSKDNPQLREERRQSRLSMRQKLAPPLPKNEQGEDDYGADSDSDESEEQWLERKAKLKKNRDVALGLADEEEGGLPEPPYDVSQLYKKRGPARNFATNSYFENFTLLVITLNGIWIGYDTDQNGAPMIQDADKKFQYAENFFCFYFTLEVGVRYMAFRKILRTSKWPTRRTLSARIIRFCPWLKDGWFKFDGVLVSMMVFETWIMPFMSSGGSGGGQFVDPSSPPLVAIDKDGASHAVDARAHDAHQGHGRRDSLRRMHASAPPHLALRDLDHHD